MWVDRADEMVEQNPHPFENGCLMRPEGGGIVAVRTPMPGCTGAMVEWWFGHVETTEDYLPWHPEDHVSSAWKGERGTGRYIGGTHLVREKLGNGPVQAIKVQFHDPSEIFDTSAFGRAGVSVAIHAHVGPQKAPFSVGKMVHMVHDTAEGCVMRSRFWLGEMTPNIPVLSGLLRRFAIKEDDLKRLHTHCFEEMSTLATFLPALFEKHTKEAQ